MPYVQRNDTGVVVALFAQPQEGIPQEFLPDDDPAVLAISDPLAGPDYSIPKDLPWRRMTDGEAATTEQLLDATSARLRQIYNAASVLNTGDELFSTLQATLTGAFGDQRAAELLARA